jgi:hypothetical protein
MLSPPLSCGYADNIIQKAAGDQPDFPGDQMKEETAFKKLLLAFHGRHYTITTNEEFRTMTGMADYYCALPIFSATLTGALYQSPGFTSGIGENAIELFGLAFKLRSKLLFNECLIHILGPWKDPKFGTISDLSLRRMAQTAYHILCVKVISAHQDLINVMGASRAGSDVTKCLSDSAKALSRNGYVQQPEFYARLAKDLWPYGSPSNVKRLISNSLVFNPCATAGVGKYADFFLCATIHEPPWDETETDW